jgi:hypothetical protein
VQEDPADYLPPGMLNKTLNSRQLRLRLVNPAETSVWDGPICVTSRTHWCLPSAHKRSTISATRE